MKKIRITTENVVSVWKEFLGEKNHYIKVNEIIYY